MAVVDRLGHARAIAMFGLDRLRKPHIGGAHLLLQRMTTAGEIGFDPLDARFLLRRQVELAVKQRMQFGLARPWRRRDPKIGRAACRERGSQTVWIRGVGVTSKKRNE